jgi:hypothetical protein
LLILGALTADPGVSFSPRNEGSWVESDVGFPGSDRLTPVKAFPTEDPERTSTSVLMFCNNQTIV